MAAAGRLTIKVSPDLSAFRQATPDEVAEVLSSQWGHGNMTTADALAQKFWIIPRG